METFTTWLQTELDSRNWKQADLSRESGLDSAVISNILNGHRNVGETTAKAIAQALQLPPEIIFRKSGLLPPNPDIDEYIEQIMHEIKDFTEEEKEEFLHYVRMKNNLRKKRNK